MDTVTSTTGGCDTVVTITITEDPLLMNAVSLSHCPGDSVMYNGVYYTAPGSPYIDTVASMTGGCDTIVTITVTEESLVPLAVSASHCAGDSVQVYGEWYTASGSPYTDTVASTTGGCDTVVTITITEDPLLTNAVSLSHCPGDSVMYNGEYYTAAGSPYIDTIASTTGGCDTIVTITVTEETLVPLAVSASHCAGDSVQVYGEWYTASGSPYTDTVASTTGGCDTVVTITITEDPLETNAVSLSHCPGDSVMYNGEYYTAAGSPYIDTVASTTGGCDTIVTITVTEESLVPLAVSASHCAGDSVQVYGEWYTASGSPYTDTVASTTGGCDTVVTITITEDPLETNAVSLSHCPGDSVMYNGEYYTAAGSPYIDTVASTTGGCDTIVTITVTEESLIPLAVSASHCAGDSVQVYGEWYTAAGSPFTDTIISTNGGCDTLVTITVTEDPLLTGAVSLSHCPGDSVMYNGEYYTANGSPYIDTITSTTGGCDTVVTITVTEQSLIPLSVSASHCAGDSVQVYGEWYTASGSPYTDTVASTTGGCDTVVTISVTEDPVSVTPVTVGLCAGQVYTAQQDGQTYPAPGNVQDTLFGSAANGCDSILDVTLVEVFAQDTTIMYFGCTGDGFSIIVNGTVYDETNTDGIETIIGGSVSGCDSVITIDLNFTDVSITCGQDTPESGPGASDGIGSVVITGGSPDYTITWSGPQSGSLPSSVDGEVLIPGLSEGDYTVIVTDASGCSDTCQFTIDGGMCELAIIDVIIVDASCPGSPSGSIQVHTTGGTLPLEFSINAGTPQADSLFIMLPSGAYDILVTDANGCTADTTVQIGAGQGPELTVVDSMGPDCVDPTSGFIRVAGNNGLAPYQYSINGGPFGPNANFVGLTAGVYEIVLLDDAGCTDTVQVVLVADMAPVLDGVTVVNATCGNSDGELTIFASGGTGTLQYSITGGPPYQISNVFSGLSASIYNIQVIDDNGCTADTIVEILDVGAPVIDDVELTPTGCDTNIGEAIVHASGGVGDLSYRIDGGAWSSDSVFTGLSAGLHTIDVIDENGCSASIQISIGVTDGPQINILTVVHTTCGEDNGSFSISVSGGTGDITVLINDVETPDVEFNNLGPGEYVITALDENLCEATDIVIIEESEGPDLLGSVFESGNCGICDGYIIAESLSGTPPFLYSLNGSPWSPNNEWFNLCQDVYTVGVQDATGCEYFEDVFIDNLPGPTIDTVVIVAATCGEPNGSIEITATAFSDMMFSIDCIDYFDSPVFTGLPPGPITICVIDEDDCVTTLDIVIPDTPGPEITDVETSPSGCNEDIGTIEITATGGTAPLEYSIGGAFQPSNMFTMVATGNYWAIVQDANGCLDSVETFVGSPPLDTIVIDTVICDTSSITIGGTDFDMDGDYTILLPGSGMECDTVVLLTLGTIVCCDPDSSQLSLTVCPGDVVDFEGTMVSDSGSYVHTIPGGSVNGCDSIILLQLNWYASYSDTLAFDLCSGEIVVTQGDTFDTDAVSVYSYLTVDGCDSVVTVEVALLDAVPADAGPTDTLFCNSTATIGGSNPLGTILWIGPGINAGNETDPNPEVNMPGWYYLNVTSPDGCVSVDSVEVALDDATPAVTGSVSDSLSCKISSVDVSTAASGSNLVYQWTGPGINGSNVNSSSFSTNVEGVYTVFVTDTVSGCVSAVDTVVIMDITYEVIAIVQDPGSFDCYTSNLSLNSDGSTNSDHVIYLWFDSTGTMISGDTSSTINIENPGEYLLTVLDTVSGCFKNDTINVRDLREYPSVWAGEDGSLDCNDLTTVLNDGAVGNNPNVIYYWTGPGIVGDTNGLSITVDSAGWYTLYARDTTNGCRSEDSAMVVSLMDPPVAEAGPDDSVYCEDQIVLFTADGSDTGTNFSYVWNGPGVSNQSGFELETGVPGLYELTVINNETGCEAIDSVLLEAGDFLDANPAMQDPACLGDASGMIDLSDVSGGQGPFMYSVGGAFQDSPIFENLTAGQYTVYVQDINGCEWQSSVTLNQGPVFNVTIGDDIHLMIGDTIQLESIITPGIDLIDSIVWSPGEMLSCNTCPNPVLTAFTTATISATIYAGIGCEDSDQLRLSVDRRVDIHVPNVFSPNGDNVNDYVTVYAGENVVTRIVEFEIFDRWGEKVFQLRDFQPNIEEIGWDGTFRGKMMQPAVFVHRGTAELIDGSIVKFSGDITLLR